MMNTAVLIGKGKFTYWLRIMCEYNPQNQTLSGKFLDMLYQLIFVRAIYYTHVHKKSCVVCPLSLKGTIKKSKGELNF